MSSPVLGVERMIPAPGEWIFQLLADPSKHPLIDGSGSVGKIISSDARLRLGSEFTVAMRIGVSYRITNRVVEFEEGRLIAWRHWAGHRWRYVLTPVAGGTQVREEWDTSRLPPWGRIVLRCAGFPARNRRGMHETLRRLDQVARGAGDDWH